MDNLATRLISRSSAAPTRRRLNVLNNAYARPLFGGSIHSFHQPAATFSASSTDKTTAANAIKEPQKKWYSFATDPIKKAWRQVKSFFYDIGIGMIATPLKHLFLRPTLMRSLLPHGNTVMDNPLHLQLLNKKYELSNTHALIKGAGFHSLDKVNGKEINLQEHWLVPKNKKPTYITVMCNGVGADWTYQLALAEKLVDDGAMVMMYNNRGHDKSGKELCTMGVHEAKDLASAIIRADVTYKDILTSKESGLTQPIKKMWEDNKPPVFVYGHSMGGATALYMAHSVDEKNLNEVNNIVDGFILDAPYAQMDVFSLLPDRIETGLKNWKQTLSQHDRWFSLLGNWFAKKYLTDKKITKIKDGEFINSVGKRLSKELLNEVHVEQAGFSRIKEVASLIPGKLASETALRQARRRNNPEPKRMLNKAMLYISAADDSDTTTPGDSMNLNTDPLMTVRDASNAIENIKFYGYFHNSSSIWAPFEVFEQNDEAKAKAIEIVGEKNYGDWNNKKYTTSLREGAIKQSDFDNKTEKYSENAQVKAITGFINRTLKAKKAMAA